MPAAQSGTQESNAVTDSGGCLLSDGLQRGHDIADTDTAPDSHSIGGSVDGDVLESGDVNHDCIVDTVQGLGPAMAAVCGKDLAGVCVCVFHDNGDIFGGANADYDADIRLDERVSERHLVKEGAVAAADIKTCVRGEERGQVGGYRIGVLS